jgi:hypothetical protein
MDRQALINDTASSGNVDAAGPRCPVGSIDQLGILVALAFPNSRAGYDS